MKSNKLIIVFVAWALLIIHPPCSFALNQLTVSPPDLWYDIHNERWVDPLYPQIQINAECNYSTIDEAYIKKTSQTISKIKLHDQDTPDKYYAIEDIIDLYKLTNSGTYTISTACGNETLTTEFTIHNLKGSIENINGFSAEGHGPVYLGNSYLDDNDELFIYVKLHDIVDHEKIDISIEEDITFSKVTFLENTDIRFSDLPYYGPMVVILKDLNDKGISKDTEYTLKMEVKYIIDGSAKIFSFNAKRPIVFGDKPIDTPVTPSQTQPLEQSITLSHDSEIQILDESNKRISLKIIPHNIANFTLYKENIHIKLYRNNTGSKDIDIDTITRNGNDWHITLKNMPSLDSTISYNLKIDVTYNSITESDIIEIRQAVIFQGVMKDSSGVVTPATIEFDGTTYEETSVSNDGRYKASLVPGFYDITITYNKFSSTIPLIVKIYNAEINQNKIDMAPDPIKFSHYSKNVNIDDISVADLVDLQFALPFKSATIKMPYDESKIYDDREIEVIMCSNWNYERKDCVGKWTTLDDISINTINNFISFNSDKLSAFVISGKETLILNIEALPENYYSEEKIAIRGKIVNNNDIPVKSSTVNYFIKNTNIFGNIKTDIDGTYEAEFNAPKDEGKYELIINTQKEPYHSSENQTLYVNIQKKKDLTLILPEISSIILDDASQSEVKFKIKNTGQSDLTNIKISASAQGLSRDKYTIEPSIIDNLEVENEKEIVIRIPLTSKYCQDMGCMTIYSFTLTVSADQLNDDKTANMIIEIKTKDDASISSDDIKKEEDELKEPDNESDDKGILESLADIMGAAKESPQITGMIPGTHSQNSQIILTTIILCFIILALKRRRRQMTPAYSRNSTFKAIKRHIRANTQ